MASIFISYRREDSRADAGRLYDHLHAHFAGKHEVFMDLDSIEPGEDFVDAIKRTVASCDVLIAVIGRQWLASVDEQGHARLQNPADFVRVEIQAALDRKIRVIPALVGGAVMPRTQDLPPELGTFARRNAFSIHDDSFAQSMSRLVESLEKALPQTVGPSPQNEASVPPELVATPLPVPPVKDAPQAAEISRWQVLAGVGALLALVVLVVVLLWPGRGRGPGSEVASPGGNAPAQAPKEQPRKEEASAQAGRETASTDVPIKTAAITPPSSQSKLEATRKESTAGRQARTNAKDDLIYVWIPPGRFTMGCSQGDSECDGDEKPTHEVIISKGFWLGQTEVTQEAYQRVIGSNPSYFKGSKLPVETVSGTEADAYCRATGGRLPTEAEWEYAARAGSTSPRYGDIDNIAWYDKNSSDKTHKVAQKAKNAWGLYDMLGNVWEWVADWYAAYPAGGSVTDPRGPARGTARVLRGGSWHVSRLARVSSRGDYGPATGNYYVGFRCAGD